MKKKMDIILITIFVVLVLIGAYMFLIKSEQKSDETDAIKFSQEYNLEDKENVFVYKTSEEIIKILENGTGVVYLGFPECPWCMEYVKHLNKTAKENNVSKIYYKNILNERKENTQEYQKIVGLLSDYLQYDEEGNKRVYVPAVIVVNNGVIVGFDDETAWDTKGFKTPTEYWKERDLDDFKTKLKVMFSKITSNTCKQGCN